MFVAGKNIFQQKELVFDEGASQTISNSVEIKVDHPEGHNLFSLFITILPSSPSLP